MPLDCFDGSRCSACPGTNRIVPGYGDRNARIMFIAEAPGENEDLIGIPLVGKAGQEFEETYLFRARIDPTDIYKTNTLNCRPGNNKKPRMSEVLSCSEKFLKQEIDIVNPRLLVLMGATACSLCDVPIDLQRDHGTIVKCNYLGREHHCFITYHPAAGMHNTTQMIPILEDFEELRKIANGTYVEPIDEYPHYEYRELTERGDVRSVMEKLLLESKLNFPEVGMDTETDPTPGYDKLWCMTFSTAYDNGFLIRAERTDLLAVFAEYAGFIDAVIHNNLFDLDPLEEQAGISIYKVTDTMKMSYHQGNTPQGLKPLAWRLLRMPMRAYEDVVAPYSREKIIEWMLEAQDISDRDKIIVEHPYKKPRKDKVTGEMKTARIEEKPTELSKFFKRVIDNTVKPQESEKPYDPWLRLNELLKGSKEKEARPELFEPLFKRIGKWPIESIIHVPFEEAKDYACLSWGSKVSTLDGCMAIGDMVRTEYSGYVNSYSEELGMPVSRRITGYHRVDHKRPVEWLSVITDKSRHSNRNDYFGLSLTRYTPDHRLLTPSGYRRISTIKQGDSICHPRAKLNSIEWQVVYGSVLGDGYIVQRNKLSGWASLSFSHGSKQRSYMNWKRSLLVNISSKVSKFLDREVYIGNNLTKRVGHRRVLTETHPELVSLRKLSYPEPNRKRVSSWIMRIDRLALAVWYQDDGTLVDNSLIRLYTLGFPQDDVELLRAMLLYNFGIGTSTGEARPGQWYIHINKTNGQADKFFELIAPYVHPSMDYKLPKQFRHKFIDPRVSRGDGLVLATVLDVVKNPLPPSRSDGLRGPMHSYCIDVEETHNFFTLAEVAHNCADARAALRIKPVLMKRCDEIARLVSRNNWDV